KSAINDSIRYSGNAERHFVLFYEDLVQEPKLWLGHLLRFLELDAGEAVLEVMLGGGESIEGHIISFEDWKKDAERPFGVLPVGGGDRPFTESEMNLLEREIAGVDLSALRTSAANCGHVYFKLS
ncbi:MAG: hypothetical protein HRT77_15710, partial [Halioglobus sp.]|nr:hypothetical protein [Halioglobus sp.]